MPQTFPEELSEYYLAACFQEEPEYFGGGRYYDVTQRCIDEIADTFNVQPNDTLAMLIGISGGRGYLRHKAGTHSLPVAEILPSHAKKTSNHRAQFNRVELSGNKIGRTQSLIILGYLLHTGQRSVLSNFWHPLGPALQFAFDGYCDFEDAPQAKMLHRVRNRITRAKNTVTSDSEKLASRYFEYFCLALDR
jgi:hypothetical protein